MFFLGSLLGGFREGELLVLEWHSVSYEDHSISIQQSISLTEHGKAMVKSPKTKSSIRIVDMTEWYMQDLKKFHNQSKLDRMNVGEQWEDDERNFVFHHTRRNLNNLSSLVSCFHREKGAQVLPISMPCQSDGSYWHERNQKQITRDKHMDHMLRGMGHKVFRLRESIILKEKELTVEMITNFVD